ncbi:FG-GAP-like repeat-containing protein [Streptomyces griseoloalbus]|uniref:Integrin-like protein n=1 Tax=Streptomyces griseoloalbus TaxID=67303 RepID=A0A7W8FCT2_9ACTN|nr:FG-GAP-like repeat-containing protein [Streptomyces albaduncus]MBB5129694.1 hypothetical protein [Streptomyces albaduncus]GGW63075.1 hypothetical protein GCM10010340_46870 [Streptomyces albaduncus]
MRTRTTATALAVTLLTTGLTPILLLTPASAAAARHADDFNGDGYRDLVTAAPMATVDGKDYAGAVVVHYGSANGITATDRTVITQNSAGVPDSAEEQDEFGRTTASGDLNNDGYADLVIGADREDVGSDADGGYVAIVWGGANGLSGGLNIPDPAVSAHDGFGSSLAVGDFTGDGRADLAVGSSGKDVWIHAGGFTKASGPASRQELVTDLQTGSINLYGAQSLAAGDVNGDGTDDLVITGTHHPDDFTYDDGQLIYLGSGSGLTLQTVLKSGAWRTATVGDLNGDGYDDVVTGAAPDTARPGDGGSISTYLGSASGVRGTPQRTIDQDTEGVPGASEDDDWFGHALATGDINGDGYDDLAVSANYEAVGTVTLTGSVTVLRGSATGLTTTGVQSFTQDTAGVPGAAEANDHFGSAVRLSDLTGDNRADLSIGADGENDADGALWNLRGASSGVTTTGAVLYGPASSGISTSGSPRLGFSMLQ